MKRKTFFAIKGPGGKNLLVTKIPIPTLDSAKQTVNPLQKSSSTNKPKQSLENSVPPKQSKLNKKLSNKSATRKAVNENIQDSKSFKKTTKTTDNIRTAITKPNQTINALSSKRCLDQMTELEQNPKHPKVLLLDSTTRNDDVKRPNYPNNPLQPAEKLFRLEARCRKISEHKEIKEELLINYTNTSNSYYISKIDGIETIEID